ncbi:Sugar phosphate permease [Methylobacterium phyllostachyos]|uniref:Sugar phosphate permease n=1 Tax=Methylobacterium phyllostachyos TaxID=582672 RepID=A0A1H0EFQ6_9HYPH|nr:MFS transporter [Methylobacterium phyllostachyos]SDN81168.1 Sugar phosphate permease [Methylobacterium phyllostachyos]
MSLGSGGVTHALRRTFTTTRGRVFALLCLVYFITYVDRVNLSTLAPLMATDLHLDNVELGFALSSFGYTYALFQILGGMTADRLGARRTLVLCGIVWTVGTLLTGFVGGLLSLVLARLLLGVGEGATFPAATTAMTRWVPTAERGYAQGVVHSCSRLANTVTPPLVVLMATYFGWRGTFMALAAVSLCWIVVWGLYFRDEPSAHPGCTPEELAELPAPRKSAGGPSDATPWAALLRGMLPTTLVYFCYNWTLWLYVTWLPSYFVKAQGLNIKESAFFAFGVFGAGVVGDALGGIWADRIYRRTNDLARARRTVIVVSLLGSMVCLLPVLFVHELAVVALCLSGAFFFLELTVGPIWAIPMDVAPKHAGTASGIMNTGSAIAGIVSPLAFGVIAQLSGSYALPFVGSIALLLVGAVLAWRGLPRGEVTASKAASSLSPTGVPGNAV